MFQINVDFKSHHSEKYEQCENIAGLHEHVFDKAIKVYSTVNECDLFKVNEENLYQDQQI